MTTTAELAMTARAEIANAVAGRGISALPSIPSMMTVSADNTAGANIKAAYWLALASRAVGGLYGKLLAGKATSYLTWGLGEHVVPGQTVDVDAVSAVFQSAARELEGYTQPLAILIRARLLTLATPYMIEKRQDETASWWPYLLVGGAVLGGGAWWYWRKRK